MKKIITVKFVMILGMAINLSIAQIVKKENVYDVRKKKRYNQLWNVVVVKNTFIKVKEYWI